jgi:hypothetical protein
MRIASLSLLALCLAAIPAMAQNDLYDNGAINGEVEGWTINFGFAVSDQFTLGGNSAVNGIQFGAWLFPGDVLQSAEVSITSSEFGGTSYFDQTVNFTQSGCFSNGGFNVCNESGSFGNVSLGAGSYWLNLANGVTSEGNPVYWDQNNGNSLASESSIGTIPSESFTIMGSGTGATITTTTTGGGTSTTPEPSSIMLFGSGILGLAGVLRRKLF